MAQPARSGPGRQLDQQLAQAPSLSPRETHDGDTTPACLVGRPNRRREVGAARGPIPIPFQAGVELNQTRERDTRTSSVSDQQQQQQATARPPAPAQATEPAVRGPPAFVSPALDRSSAASRPNPCMKARQRKARHDRPLYGAETHQHPATTAAFLETKRTTVTQARPWGREGRGGGQAAATSKTRNRETKLFFSFVALRWLLACASQPTPPIPPHPSIRP